MWHKIRAIVFASRRRSNPVADNTGIFRRCSAFKNGMVALNSVPFIACMWWVLSTGSWGAVTVSQLQIENRGDGSAQIRYVLSQTDNQRHFVLKSPDRLVIDIPKASILTDTSARAIRGQGLITRIRVGQPNAQQTRFVFDLKRPVTVQKMKQGSAWVWTLSAGKITQTSVYAKQPSTKAKPALTKSSGLGYRDVIIVIDAGHGGHDPGAIGPARATEKQVTLAIAKALKRQIDQQSGMRAVLTRDGDYYIGLRERLHRARKYNADLFISIHADAFIHAKSHGASVFALSQRGATSEAARWLAEKENYSELGGVNLKHLDDKNGLIRTVLLDLSQTATIASSLQLGSAVLGQLGKMTTLHNHRVEQARFVVLKSLDTPSILIETGFISNPTEARNLTNARYQSRLALAIFQGLKQYFWLYPPHGTRLEAMAMASKQSSFRNWFS